MCFYVPAVPKSTRYWVLKNMLHWKHKSEFRLFSLIMFSTRRIFFSPASWILSKKKNSKMLHLEHNLYGAEIWTLLKVDQRHTESSEMCCWRKMEIIWTESVKSDEE
jgi:hypothetical protein